MLTRAQLAARADALWQARPTAGPTLAEEVLQSRIARLPELARCYLCTSLGIDRPLPSAVRLAMHGQIRLGRWCPFVGEEVLTMSGALFWYARTHYYSFPVLGYDSFSDGAGALDWRLLGMLPLARADGPDVARSAAGRAAAEAVWLPSRLAGPAVQWAQTEEGALLVRLPAGADIVPLRLVPDEEARLREVSMMRWGNPEGGAFGWHPFGGRVTAWERFGGIRLPSRLEVGWLEADGTLGAGAFFRVTIDDAVFG